MKVRPLRLIEADRAADGWEELWSRDRWRGRELPHANLSGRRSQQVILHFEGLVQPWLKEATKRWVRARVLSSRTPSTMSHYLDHVTVFSRWLAQRAPGMRAPAELSRELIEDYLLAVRTSDLAGGTKWGRIGALRSLLAEQRKDGLAGLPRTTNIYMGETPRPDYRLPKGIEAFVFDQFIDPQNLSVLPNEPASHGNPAVGVDRDAGVEPFGAAARRASDRLGRASVSALREREAQARGGAADRAAAVSSFARSTGRRCTVRRARR